MKAWEQGMPADRERTTRAVITQKATGKLEHIGHTRNSA
jgi:hypothetical protein